MKKAILTALCLFVGISVNAQLKVNSGGKVQVGNPSFGDAMLNVHSSSNTSAVYLTGGTHCISIYNEGFGTTRSGVDVLNSVQTGQSIAGVNVNTYGATTNQAIYGVKAIGGNSSSGAFGVWGGLTTSNASIGAGIFGTSLPSGSISSTYQGKYAGYFYGDVRVTGSLYGTLLTPTGASDIAMASEGNAVQVFNVRGEDEAVSDKLQQVQLLQFYRSPDENKLSEDEIQAQRDYLRDTKEAAMKAQAKSVETSKSSSITADAVKVDATASLMDEDVEGLIVKEIPQTKLSAVRYGLAADQLKVVYPELVYEDKKGNVSINYIEMIPLLVQAINEVKSENNALRAEVATLKGETVMETRERTATETTAINTVDDAILSLSQNRPNPFSSSTSIEVSIPESIHSAALFIYDMSGKQIKRIDITERGTSHVSVTSEGLTEGMYLYTLAADGKIVGTKKMILTK